MVPDEYIQRLQEASMKKYKLLQEMLLLTQEQSENITEDSINNLEGLISRKQEKIDEINRLDHEFNEYFQRFKQGLGVERLDQVENRGIKGVKELQDQVQQIVELIREISRIETENSNKAKKLLKHFGEEIGKISQGKKVLSAYRPAPVQMPSYFIDKKK
ncbi:MAG: flagellar protein FlgN [Clostridiales bacterium]|jgi:uncharacterized phage infection (PIP) family protein YhgE|nr:flagellar protein FlgN [Eubacteriales bacterium]MDH7566150.1 flagellar protein FlgN [Clostridiales bacterium]